MKEYHCFECEFCGKEFHADEKCDWYDPKKECLEHEKAHQVPVKILRKYYSQYFGLMPTQITIEMNDGRECVYYSEDYVHEKYGN